MGDSPKYIIVDSQGLEIAIVFNPILSHADMAKGHKVVSAGFVSIFPDHYDPTSCVVEVYGESTTLKMSHRPEDKKIIKRSLDM